MYNIHLACLGLKYEQETDVLTYRKLEQSNQHILPLLFHNIPALKTRTPGEEFATIDQSNFLKFHEKVHAIPQVLFYFCVAFTEQQVNEKKDTMKVMVIRVCFICYRRQGSACFLKKYSIYCMIVPCTIGSLTAQSYSSKNNLNCMHHARN